MASFKRLRAATFKYLFECFRTSHLNRVIDLNEGLPIPYDSIFHDVSNFSHEGNIEPNLQFFDKLFSYTGKYFVYHNNPLKEEEFSFYKLPEDKFRVLSAGVSTRLSHFKMDNSSRTRIFTDIKNMDGIKKDVIFLINDNPLKSVRLSGMMVQNRFMYHYLSGVLDKVYQTPINIQHYIPIKISQYNYKRTDFQTILKRGFTTSSVQHPNDPYYLFMANLLAYTLTEFDTPFKNVPTREKQVGKEIINSKIEENITIIFHNDKHCCIYNLHDLMNFFKQGNGYIDRILKQINSINEGFDDEIEIVKPQEALPDNEIKDENIIINFDKEKLDDVSIELPTVNDGNDNKLSEIAKDGLYEQSSISSDSGEIPKENDGGQETSNSESSEKEGTSSEKASTGNITKVKKIIDSKVTYFPNKGMKIDHTSHLLKTDEIIDKPVKELIDSFSHYTPKQKQRLIENSNKWKDIKFGNDDIYTLMNSTNGLKPIETKDLSFLDDHVADKSYLQSKVMSFDSDYSQKLFHKDIIHSVVHLNRTGMFLTDLKTNTVKTPLEDYTEYVFKFEDTSFKQHTVKVTLPNVRSDGTIISRGSVKKIYKQRINKPICKIDSDTVSLFSDYNKYLVERVAPARTSLLGIVNNFLFKKNANKTITFQQSKHVDTSKKYPLELTQLAMGYDWIKIGDIYLNFNLSTIKYIEEKQMWEIGYLKDEKIFIDINNDIHFFNKEAKLKTTSYLEMISIALDLSIPSINQWTEMNLISKSFPIGIVLAYRFGIEKMFEMINLDYDIYDNSNLKDIPKDPRLLRVKFADVTITFPLYPSEQSFIVNGLNKFNLTKYSFKDLNEKETYYDIFSNEGFSPNYLLEINNFFDFFIDPATYEVLLHMGEPTTPEGILIRATEMLKDFQHPPASSASNFRTRSQGKIPAILYNELTKQLAAHRRPMNRENKFSINPKSVYQRVLQDALTENADVNNPIGAIKDATSFSYVGFGGRTPESFVIRDRIYSKDAIGIVSEATVDSSNVAIRAQYSMNPNVVNLRGVEEPVDIESVEPGNMLSITGLLFPGVTCDDGKRQGFANIQASQVEPTEFSQMMRLRTTYEKVVPHLCKMPFVFMAEDNGKVVEINDELKLIKIEYNNGKKYCLEFGDLKSRYSAAGMYIKQSVSIHSSVRSNLKFKKNEPIVFNTSFFQEDPFSNQIMMKLGCRGKIALLDTDGTIDDSNMISASLSKKLNFTPIHDRQIVLNRDFVIHAFADIGTKVNAITPLLTFEEYADNFDIDEKDYDEETLYFLRKLNRKTPKAEFTGVITDIKVQYTSPLNTMSESMQKFIKYIDKSVNKKASFSSDTENSIPQNAPIEYTDKIGFTDLDEDTVIITFYIEDEYSVKHGDKVSFAWQMKSVTSSVYRDPIYTEDGSMEIDGVFGGLGFMNRIVNSPITFGTASIALEKLQNDILNMYYGTR